MNPMIDPSLFALIVEKQFQFQVFVFHSDLSKLKGCVTGKMNVPLFKRLNANKKMKRYTNVFLDSLRS